MMLWPGYTQKVKMKTKINYRQQHPGLITDKEAFHLRSVIPVDVRAL